MIRILWIALVSIAVAVTAAAYLAGVRVMLLPQELGVWWFTSSDDELGPSTSIILVPYRALAVSGGIAVFAAIGVAVMRHRR